MQPDKKKKWQLSRPARISLGYLATAVLWILVSDALTATLVQDHETHFLVQSWKGLGFVTVTALVMYVLMRTPAPAAAAAPDTHGAVLLGLTFLLLVALIAGTGTLAYRHQATAFKKQQHSQQAAIAELKAVQIRRWVDRGHQQAEILRRDPDLLEAARRLATDNAPDADRHVRLHFDALLEAGEWTAIGLYAADGRPLLQAGEAREPETALRQAIAHTAADGGFRLHDVHPVDAAGRTYRIDFLLPLPEAAGVLVLSADPLALLFSMAQSWPIPSDSSEALLLRVEGDHVVFITPPRRSGARPTEQRVPLADTALSSPRDRKDGKGIFEGRDFRGIEVIAAFESVPGTPWHIVAKTDTEEVLRPLRRQAGQIFAMVLLAIGISALFVVLLWRNRQAVHAASERQAQAERTALALRFEALFQQARDIILLADPAGRIVEANEAALAAYGYTAEEIRTLQIRDLRDPDSLDSLDRQFNAADRPGGIQFETVHRRKDGSPFPVEISSRVVEIGGQRFRQSFIRDIGERRRAEETVRRQLDELRRWYEVTLDREDRIGELKAEVNALRQRLGEPPRYGQPQDAAPPSEAHPSKAAPT
ncbi:MAG: PAS domain S-box protein [Denitratisoma sp.]|nr:PAS domain S-box protein [Denitratisoma sp.]